MRSNEARELIRANPFAFILAWVIADRGRYNPSFNKDNLKLGEAMLGDFKMCGMSHRQYRTAVEQLSKWGFATFRKTNKGTIGRLVDARLFSIFRIQADNQNGNRPTIKRQAADKQPTTNKSSKSSKSLKERGEKEQPPPTNCAKHMREFPSEIDARRKLAEQEIQSLKQLPRTEANTRALNELKRVRRECKTKLLGVQLPEPNPPNPISDKPNPRARGEAAFQAERERLHAMAIAAINEH